MSSTVFSCLLVLFFTICPIPFYPLSLFLYYIIFYLILSYLILSYLILSYLILSYLILSCFIPLFLDHPTQLFSFSFSRSSIDGCVWEGLRKDFTILLKNLPGPEKLKKITKKHLDRLMDSMETIDANSVALVTMKVFVEYLFEREWESSFDVLVAAR